jgi:hypothetical protein
MIKYSILFSWIIFLSGCFGFGQAYYEKLNNLYFLEALDIKDQMTLYVNIDGQGIGVVPQTVFAVGLDDSFIIIKQHPQDSLHHINVSVTNFYIVPLKMRVSPTMELNVIGPMQEEEFKEKRKSLGIADSLDFTRTFKDLENDDSIKW